MLSHDKCRRGNSLSKSFRVKDTTPECERIIKNTNANNANGENQPSVSPECNQHADFDHAQASPVVAESIENEIANKNQTAISTRSMATQTSDDEILKAIHELAEKYASVDNTLNDPCSGVLYHLAKTKETVSGLHTDIHGAVSGIKVRLDKVLETSTANSEKIAKMEESQRKIASLLDENKRLVNELKTMQGLIQKAFQQSSVNSSQIVDLTHRGMEQNLIFHGVDNSIEVEGRPST